MDLYDVGIMALRGVSTSIFDVFFLFAVFAGYLVMVRFRQVNIYAKTMKSSKDMMIELVVQGIVIGVVFSLVVTFLGIPVMFTEYLYFILPLSFVLGYHHVRYSNIVYSALIMAVFGFVFNGQEILGRAMPQIDLNMGGLMGIVGILLLIEGILLFLLRGNDMVPIVAKREGNLVVGFAMQRFWPVPVVLLTATEAAASGETIPMPEWWPVIGGGHFGELDFILFLLPLLFILTHGTISFTKSPKAQLKRHSLQQLISGLVLIAGAFLADRFEGLGFLGILLLFAVSYVPDWYFEWREEKDDMVFPKTRRGVRVLHVEYESLGDELGIEAGDLIKEINGIEVTNLYQMSAIFKDRHTHFIMIIQKPEGHREEVRFEKRRMMEQGLKVTWLPDEPEKVFDYDQVKRMGMMHMVHFHGVK